MCGICGIINFSDKPVSESLIKQIMAKMKHRGPDDEGTYLNKNIGLGFVRLSILDLSPLGHQPMFDDSGRYLITHNGEVYNFIEIREELKAKGHIFRSNTDTEVILKAYIEWGEECLNKFNGMWAFCIYDTESKEMFIARDRYGVKPFYYFLDGDQFIYASEIPAILSVLDEPPNPNFQTIFDYMVFNRTDQTEDTFFYGIKKLQHGHTIKIKGSDIIVSKWYDLRERVLKTEGFKNPKEYKDLFSSAVGLRLRSDVPVGVCLSGGLDSSSIVSILLKYYAKEDLNTFSAVYSKGSYGDESEFIAEFKTDLKNMFFTEPTARTLFNDLHRFITAHAEPVPATGPYAQFKVMELAKGNVVVTLDGQGADESLAGYHYFFGLFFKELFTNFRFILLLKEFVSYYKLHRSSFGLKSFLFFLLPAHLRTKARVSEKKYFGRAFVEKYQSQNSVSVNLYGSRSIRDALIDHFEYKLEHLLKWEDRNSMFFSLESRVPFLDYRLVEKTLASHPTSFIRNGWTKAILRDAMKGILPEKIRKRKDKIGFGTPQAEWFKEESFVLLTKELINEGFLSKYEIIDVDSFFFNYDLHLKGEKDFSKEIWKVISMEVWFKLFGRYEIIN